MKFKINLTFISSALILVPIMFCLFIFGIQVLGQKTNKKKSSITRPINKKKTTIKSLADWAETRNSNSPRKLALLIGISDYSSECRPMPNKPCWWNLHGKTDVNELGKILRGKNFEFEVNKLTDSKATKQAIKQAFEKLISITQADDIIYIHFSGHGTTAPDQPAPYGDENDGMDEAIVPFDYGYRDNKSRLIIDDEINKWLSALKDRKPLSVTVTFDSCNSGTATRGGLKRGGPWLGKTVKDIEKRNSDTSASGLVENNKNPDTGFVYISASSPNEAAVETDTEPQMGVFTQALIKILDGAKPNTTYRDAFEKIKDTVTRSQGSQNPQIEGNQDNLLLGNSAIATETYYMINTEASNYILQAGTLHGMRTGSKFAIYEAGTKYLGEEGSRKLTDAEITETRPLNSVLKFEKPVKSTELIGARAFETARKLDIDALKVVIDNKLQEGNVIQEAVKSYGFAQLLKQGSEKNRKYDLIFRQRERQNDKDLITAEGNIIMERLNGSIRVFSSTGDKLKEEIKEALKQEVRWKTVKELESTKSSLQVEMRIVRIDKDIEDRLNDNRQRRENDYGTPIESIFGSNGLELSVGDHARIEVKNNGNEPVYITILGLSDGRITANFPRRKEDLNDEKNKILPNGQWKPISVFRVTPPLGIDAYKLIATKEAADFSSLVDPSIPQERSKGNLIAKTFPIGQLFKMLSDGNNRDNPVNPTSPENWTTTTISYQIKCPIIDGVKKCCVDRTQTPWTVVECKN